MKSPGTSKRLGLTRNVRQRSHSAGQGNMPVSGDTRFCSAVRRMPSLILRAASAATLLLLLPMFQSLDASGEVGGP